MLQGIRASTLTMPSFGQNLSLTGVHRMEGYGDVDPWSWSHQSNASSQNYPAVFDPSLYNFAPHAPQSVQPRHHSVATSHGLPHPTSTQSHTATPPPPRPQVTGSMIKAQPAFKPTWHGFLDTTKDAMTIVEAALQGRLSHISRRPHDKERAEMLTSGTVLVYEENASGIKRWTDAVHWSPSRVMNNCLIYRQLVRALKPEEKKAALNPSCGSKRKRKESASPSVTNTGESINHADDEYEHSTLDTGPGDATPTESFGKVYANFAQSLTPDQQRRYCGSLIDSYEFKEGGLMKKTISVKYQGTHHHIISYYSLEDVVNGKLNRPFQDPKLANIQPRPELLTGWKVSLEDEESKDMPLVTGYSQHIPHSHVQHPTVGPVTHGLPAPTLHLQVPTEYWHGSQVQQYASPTHHSPQHFAPPQHTTSPYTQQAYQPQPSSTQQFPQQAPSHQYSSQHPPAQQYHPHPTPASQFPSQPQATQHYPSGQHISASQQYPEQHSATQYQESQHTTVAQDAQYAVPQTQVFDVSIPVPQTHTPVQQSPPNSLQHHDTQRRASAPVTMQSYGQSNSQPQYQAGVPPQNYYIPNEKFPAGSYGY